MINKQRMLLWGILITVFLTGCANLRQAKLDAGNDPVKAVAEVSKIETVAQKQQLDVLADQSYAQGHEYLTEARQGLKDGGTKDDVLRNAAIAKAFFQDAKKIGLPRQSDATRILDARARALAAGVRNSDALVESLGDIDDDLKSETKQFSRALSPDDFSDLQKRYLALEVKAVQYRELGAAKHAIAKARDDNASNLAPKTLRNAVLDYETGINMIAQGPRSPSEYKKSVQVALASATQLVDVMNVIKGAPGTPENIAVQIVQQKRALGELTTNLGKLKENLVTTQHSLQQKEGALKQTEGALMQTQGALKQTQGTLKQTQGTLKSQQQQLAMASTQVRFQHAMDEARRTLPANDALVYQQGNKLVFRLKRMNFKSGTAIIPATSKPLLTKVDAIIRRLNVDNVIVQGHTDSIGSAESNKKLSTARATAVANYLYSLGGGYKLMYVGYGESRPIATNDTAKGRATNRRVDLVVSVKQ